MNKNSNSGWRILGAASVLGLFGDLLLRAAPWGVNFPLWTLMLAILVLLLNRKSGENWQGEGRWMFLPAFLFPVTFAWRDSTTLLSLNFAAASGALIFALFRARSGTIRVMSLIETAMAGCLFLVNICAGFLLLLIEDLPWKNIPPRRSKSMLALFRGSLLAVPPLLLFGGLFMAADAAFEGIVTEALHWFFKNIFSHLFLAGLVLWISGGILRQLFLSSQWTPSAKEHDFALSIGLIETSVLLGVLNLLVLSFVVIQIRYFFGGANLVETSATITYAEYARRGFFELVAVSLLVLPLLLGAHWLVRNEKGLSQRIFRVLAGVLLLLLFVIMASALQRMRLYQQEYGLTELRFYTTVFMGWLAILFLWFGATVMRGKRERFAAGAIFTGMTVIALLNVVNPDAWIVRTNTARILEQKPFDAGYAVTLGAETVPVLLDALPQMNPNDRRLVSDALLRRWSPANNGWRTWNWSRYWAASKVAQHTPILQQSKKP